MPGIEEGRFVRLSIRAGASYDSGGELAGLCPPACGKSEFHA